MTTQPGRRWPMTVFRIVITGEAVLALAQAALAGSFLSGNYGALHLHDLNGMIIEGVGLLQIIAGVLLWRPGGGRAWPAWTSALLVVAEDSQIGLGHDRTLAVHVPLGVTIIACIALMLVWAWRPERTKAVTA